MKEFIAKLNKMNLASGNEYIFLSLTLFLSFSVGVCAYEDHGESFGMTMWRCLCVTSASFFAQRMLRRIPKGVIFVIKFVMDEFKRRTQK